VLKICHLSERPNGFSIGWIIQKGELLLDRLDGKGMMFKGGSISLIGYHSKCPYEHFE